MTDRIAPGPPALHHVQSRTLGRERLERLLATGAPVGEPMVVGTPGRTANGHLVVRRFADPDDPATTALGVVKRRDQGADYEVASNRIGRSLGIGELLPVVAPRGTSAVVELRPGVALDRLRADSTLGLQQVLRAGLERGTIGLPMGVSDARLGARVLRELVQAFDVARADGDRHEGNVLHADDLAATTLIDHGLTNRMEPWQGRPFVRTTFMDDLGDADQHMRSGSRAIHLHPATQAILAARDTDAIARALDDLHANTRGAGSLGANARPVHDTFAAEVTDRLARAATGVVEFIPLRAH